MSDALAEVLADEVRAVLASDPWLAGHHLTPPDATVRQIAERAAAVARAYDAGEFD
jgi:hypothetical protein